ncbi:MAG TPA: lactate racemase domain-containing protein, partial [Candidatus Hydrogenedentes bacterium]|nr:lactate racemase domain-containing protein [Candidatus Hydrogenedentota bacterium]
MISRIAPEGAHLSDEELRAFVGQAFADAPVDGRKILFVIPDSTRSMPMPAMFRALCATLSGRAAQVDFLVALGTHPPMSEEALNRLLGISAEERQGVYRDVGVYNHEWQNPEALAFIGTLDEDEIARLSNGLMRQSARVMVNKRLMDYDLVCIVGPVFPHEVVGFSGGNKYFFPGVAGEEILNLFHWLGALITNPKINGTKDTRVRAVVNRAASLIPVEKR